LSLGRIVQLLKPLDMLAEAKHLPVASAKRLVTRVRLTLAYRIQVLLPSTVKLIQL
jgi:hypothetical protein